MKVRFYAAAGAMLLTAAIANAADEPLTGGPFAGMFLGNDLWDANGLAHYSVRPSKPNASPVPANLQTVIEDFLQSYSAGKNIGTNSIEDGATNTFCPAKTLPPCNPPTALAKFELPEKLSWNTPYLMADGSVRLEWLKGDLVAFTTELTFNGAKIAAVRTSPAIVPMMLGSN